MKFFFVTAVASLLTSTSFATVDLFSLPVFSKSHSSLALKQLAPQDPAIKGTMACDAVKIAIENDTVKDAQIIASKTWAAELGKQDPVEIKLPTPYEKVSLWFGITSSVGTQQKQIPQIQAVLVSDGQIADSKDALFDIPDAKAGSTVLLRGFSAFDASTILAYQCSFTF